ncbi:hypothetical protein AAG570_003749 [Ranatra chinensis]|uniref:Uncharacterized protein n=1 Tax=Ranatra chinensis TaxID=642074 RepID=A0ABD0Y6S9_9HEMI
MRTPGGGILCLVSKNPIITRSGGEGTAGEVVGGSGSGGGGRPVEGARVRAAQCRSVLRTLGVSLRSRPGFASAQVCLMCDLLASQAGPHPMLDTSSPDHLWTRVHPQPDRCQSNVVGSKQFLRLAPPKFIGVDRKAEGARGKGFTLYAVGSMFSRPEDPYFSFRRARKGSSVLWGLWASVDCGQKARAISNIPRPLDRLETG